MIVSLPANPVGSVGNPALYEELVAFAKKYDILLIHDNAYSDIIFDGAEGRSLFNTPGAMDVGVEFFSLSKSFDVTGARISFLVGRPDVVAAFRRLRGQIDFGMSCRSSRRPLPPSPVRWTWSRSQCKVYQQRRDALCGGLRSIGWDVARQPRQHVRVGAHSAKYASSMDFCRTWWKRAACCAPPVPASALRAKATSALR